MVFEAVYYFELTIACGFLKETHVIDSAIFETAQNFNFCLMKLSRKYFSINISNYKEIDKIQRDKREI